MANGRRPGPIGRSDDHDVTYSFGPGLRHYAGVSTPGPLGRAEASSPSVDHPKAPYPVPKKGEVQIFVRAYAPFDTFGRFNRLGVEWASFGGDRRTGASTRTQDTARLSYVIPINIAAMKPDTGRKHAFCDPSHGTGLAVMAYGRLVGGQYDPAGTRMTKTAEARSSEFFEPVGRPGTGFAGYVAVAGANPLLPSPDIDVRLNIKMTKENGQLHLSGNFTGDRFPNGEAFIRDANDKAVLLVDFRTDGTRDGGPIERLPGHGQAITSGFDLWLPVNADGSLK